MALEYTLELSTKSTPTQTMDALASNIKGLTWGKDMFVLFDPTSTICTTNSPEITQKVIGRGFGFIPDLSVEFRFISNSDYDRFKKTMLQATMLLLEHAQDAVLLFNGETIVLQRLDGQLAFNSGYHMWDDDWLKSRLTVPFEWRPLPSPLL
ncbi:SitI3 family protein [Vitiosangium sp. GDMCC 1.1324]|uniref:SitI3 family protein n=1 Tax=Vitiosangium sp. (strain GDMCC 1.1324) TaxID=2138576 RepID=UPI000D345538|nr:SitI3 family protein [Vitiosangium sp. GDMCC 1.1324]PTL83157.1 hypothetical protein DAT35_14205 [Vitiosangium sp. GDMCC 1.1324]